jgi:hypothetical protein
LRVHASIVARTRPNRDMKTKHLSKAVFIHSGAASGPFQTSTEHRARTPEHRGSDSVVRDGCSVLGARSTLVENSPNTPHVPCVHTDRKPILFIRWQPRRGK